MSKALRNLMVVLVAVLMFLSSAFTPVQAEETETVPADDEVTKETIESDEQKENTETGTASDKVVDNVETVAPEETEEDTVSEEAEEDAPDLSGVSIQKIPALNGGFTPNAEGGTKGVGDEAPAISKKLIDNGDGTYTLALSVTGETQSSSQTTYKKSNVILVLDTSNSMVQNSTWYNSQYMSRMDAMKHVLCDDDGIIDKMLANNTDDVKDIIEIAVVDFGTKGVQQLDFTYDKTALKNTINGLETSKGTNWEEALQQAKAYADSIKNDQQNENVYIIFMTDGEPTTHAGSYQTQNSTEGYQNNWNEAKDEANAIATTKDYIFYGIFTWGKSSSSKYLSSLVQYAYTGSGTYNSSLDDAYAEYFTDATETEKLIEKLESIASTISTNVGFTNVDIADGVTSMTSSSIKTSTGGTGNVTGAKYYRSGGSYGSADFDNRNFGAEWADAPAASINDDGEVDWDLGDTVLENGVTYTITFVVWPSQDALDLVADLNNGKADYETLTEKQKSQIDKNGSTYTLKTNVDNPQPRVTYSTITTTTVDGKPTTVVSDEKTAYLTNPDPVELLGQDITVEKKWDHSLDPSQIEEVGGEVVLDLYKGTEETPYIADIAITDETDWKVPEAVSIAPGMLITADSPAYTEGLQAVSDGETTYYILEAGHDYYFAEHDINPHYELTAYTYHPMIIGNTVKNVTFITDGSGNITGISEITDMTTISATNTIKGGVNLTKKVVDEDGNTVDTDDSFELTMHMQNPDGTPYSYDYRIYFGEKNPDYDKYYNPDKDVSRTDHIYGEGDATVTLYVGDTVRFVNMDTGTRFYVTESESAYELKEIEYTIDEGATGQSTAYADADKVVDGNITWYTVKGNSSSSVVVTNTHPGYFYVYHSSDKTIEKISLSDSRVKDGKFNIIEEVKSGYIYGGYYQDYSKAAMEELDIVAAPYEKKTDIVNLTYTSAREGGYWYTDALGEAYVGGLGIWKMVDAITENGKEMHPAVNEVYYLKEVPDVYLLPASYVVYDTRDKDENGAMLVKKLYLMTATDDGNYLDVGFDFTATSKLKMSGVKTVDKENGWWAEQIKVKKLTEDYATLTAGSLINGKEGLIAGYNINGVIVQNAYYREIPYHITPDHIKVTSLKQMMVYVKNMRFNNWDKKVGMYKSAMSKKAAYEYVE